ncbi:MAG: hypothetical protein GY810_21740 [Aureispira sp.]|nr:hypothetical protein [Aureispira sp.]
MKNLLILFFAYTISISTVYSQIPNIYGDFETWQVTSQDTIPTSWFYESPWSSFVGQSTDSYLGNYSAVVNTWYNYAAGWMILGQDTSLQFWGNDWTKAGVPAGTQAFALEGYYKYTDTVSTVDSALVYILYKRYNHNLNKIDTIAYTRATLVPTENWTYFQIQIQDLQTGLSPDSLVIAFSSQWYGAGVGTNPYNRFLYLDDLNLIYTTTSNKLVKDSKQIITINPNPNNGSFVLEGLNTTDNLKLIGIDGRVHPITQMGNQFHTPANKGLYLLKIYDRDHRIKHIKKLVID